MTRIAFFILGALVGAVAVLIAKGDDSSQPQLGADEWPVIEPGGWPRPTTKTKAGWQGVTIGDDWDGRVAFN